MNKVWFVASFIFGAAVGAVSTWLLTKQHYKDIADEEIESVVEAFKDVEPFERQTIEDNAIENPHESLEIHQHSSDSILPKDNFQSYKYVIESNGYIDYSTSSITPKVKDPFDTETHPERGATIITEKEFGNEMDRDFIGYATFSCTYYSEDSMIIDDETNEPLEDYYELAGDEYEDILNDEMEPDIVYIRNDERKAFLEIGLVHGAYRDTPDGKRWFYDQS